MRFGPSLIQVIGGLFAVVLITSACASSGDDTQPAVVTDPDVAHDSTSATTTLPPLPPPTTAEFLPETKEGPPFIDRDLLGKIDAFQTAPNSIFASNIAAEMGLSGDVRWGPWLLDILRVVSSSETNLTAIRALQDLSGIPATGDLVPDFVRYGSWVRSSGIDPGPGYETFKVLIYSEIQPEYGPLLDGVDDIERLSGISWGGVRRGGIPELNNPTRLTAAEADFLTPDELVLGAVIGDVAIAYPLRFLARHELVNDTIGGVPVALGYCTLCRTGILFDRRVGAQTIDFQTSGLLIDSNKIMIDNQTESLWHHLAGEAISGPFRGTKLDAFPLVTTRWSDWTEEHPDTFTLDTPKPIFFPEQPDRQPTVYEYAPDAAYARYYDNEGVWFPIVEPTDVFDRKAAVITIALSGAALALALDEVESADPFVIDVGDQPVVVVPNPGGARVYDATGVLTAGASVSIAPEGVTPTSLTLDDGSVLERIISGQSLWFAWYGQHPETATWPN
jgi:hypothetical protein